MGSSQSNAAVLTSEVAVTGLILLAGAYFFATQSGVLTTTPSTTTATKGAAAGKGAKSKKKAGGKKTAGNANASDATASKSKSDIASSVDTLVAPAGDELGKASTSKSSTRDNTPLPGSFLSAPSSSDAPTTTATASKNKKKKAKSSAASTPSASTTLPPLQTSPVPQSLAHGASSSASAGGTTASSVVDDDGWTKVGRHGSEADFPSLSKAGAVAEKGKNKGKAKGAANATASEPEAQEKVEEKQTLAEKLLPKPVPTVVDDMLDAPAGIARVMRVLGPESATPQPPAGFSWRDYEDSDLAGQSQTDDDEGWASVPTKKRKTPAAGGATGSGSATPTVRHTEELTKKQRQNIARREAEKAAKADAERERLAKLAKHKRDLENERIRAQYDKGKMSGGMKASVDSNGALIWE